jgi:uncharacterized protein
MTSTFTPSEPGPNLGTPTIRSVNLTGPAGRLEALLNEGAPDAPYAALMCHPHPLGGGTMHNKVAYHAMKVLNAPEWGLQWPVLRFNFRGAGLSEGKHQGKAESADVLSALNWLENEYRRPVVVAGFSFGAAMSLAACCGSSPDSSTPVQIRAVAALGLPTQALGQQFGYRFLASCALPKLFLSGDQDVFAPISDLRHVVAAASEPKKLLLIPGADHSFSGQIEAMQQELAAWLKEYVQ